MKNKEEKEYILFGKEWEAELMKLKKSDLIAMYKRVAIRNIQLDNLNSELMQQIPGSQNK